MAATPERVRDGLNSEPELLAANPRARILIVQGPYRKAALRGRWEEWLVSAGRLPVFRELATGWVPDGAHVLAHSGDSGWTVWSARRRSDRSYALAIDAAFTQKSDTWRADWALSQRRPRLIRRILEA
jgi:hypothetical protein